MKKSFLILTTIVLCHTLVFAQLDENPNSEMSSSERMISHNNEKKLTIGGYGQIDYNQIFGGNLRKNGTLDVHRMVLNLGYHFNDKIQFVGEIEFEHVTELYVEQAFLNYKFNDKLNLRAGLMLVPMGIINEYHEPTTFNGVERSNVDTKTIPTTWREIGFGLAGNFNDVALKYQLYVFNGFNGYNGTSGLLSASNGLRKARQKGAESYISSPNLSAKIDYYGISNLKLGLASYFGKTQSQLYNNLDVTNNAALAKADSSVVGISMIGFDARYNINSFILRGQYVLAMFSNTGQYNGLTASDFGSEMYGYYLEIGYNLLSNAKKLKELIPFIRYERYNTQSKTAIPTIKNPLNDVSSFTLGLTFKPVDGVVVKSDLVFSRPETVSAFTNQINFGLGVWF